MLQTSSPSYRNLCASHLIFMRHEPKCSHEAECCGVQPLCIHTLLIAVKRFSASQRLTVQNNPDYRCQSQDACIMAHSAGFMKTRPRM